MAEFALSPDFYYVADRSGSVSGEVYHIVKNRHGGSISTPIARFFVSSPPLSVEGFNDHRRVDCYVRKHELAPEQRWLAKRLTDSLIERGVVTQPIWLSWHSSVEISGEALGEVFDLD